MLAFAAALVLTACLLLAVASRMAGATGVRTGAAVVASDMGLESALKLEDPATRIRGRPDYLLRERGRGRVYPVEVKPSRDAAAPYESDVMQLAAYMVLTEARYGRQFAGYGLVRYRSGEFRVALTPELRKQCLRAADGVRRARAASDVHRSHAVGARCRGCAIRTRCGESLLAP